MVGSWPQFAYRTVAKTENNRAHGRDRICNDSQRLTDSTDHLGDDNRPTPHVGCGTKAIRSHEDLRRTIPQRSKRVVSYAWAPLRPVLGQAKICDLDSAGS
ncbi:unnamed protein product, partial [Tilletia laevis]